MTEFKPYIERRARCQAFRFTDPNDAGFIAQALYWDARNWTLTHHGWDNFTLEVVLPAEAGLITVNRGDYLVRDPHTEASVVVPAAEFHPAWEPES